MDFHSFMKQGLFSTWPSQLRGLTQCTLSGILLSGRYSHLGVSSEVGMNENVAFSGFFQKVFRE